MNKLLSETKKKHYHMRGDVVINCCELDYTYDEIKIYNKNG